MTRHDHVIIRMSDRPTDRPTAVLLLLYIVVVAKTLVKKPSQHSHCEKGGEFRSLSLFKMTRRLLLQKYYIKIVHAGINQSIIPISAPIITITPF
eukprot:scaffold404_cov54-Cylindrotheca_fusiformis.AAC.2